MMKRVALVPLILSILLPFEVTAQKGGSHASGSRSTTSHSSTRSSSSTKRSSSKSSSGRGKTVKVKEYKRKDGTIVKTHDRSAPGTKQNSSSTSSSKLSSSGVPRKSTVAARDSNGRIKRSAEAKKDFMKQTGYPKGRKGYVVDHTVPLECGGADSPSNVQWQTATEAKIKDRTERNCRRE